VHNLDGDAPIELRPGAVGGEDREVMQAHEREVRAGPRGKDLKVLPAPVALLSRSLVRFPRGTDLELQSALPAGSLVARSWRST
jgi:hypothetical protein